MFSSVKTIFHSVQLQSLLYGNGWRALSTSSVHHLPNVPYGIYPDDFTDWVRVASSQPRKIDYLAAPDDYSGITLPERNRLPIKLKTPVAGPHQKAIRMQKNLKFMRGPEEVHNKLIHGQFGVMALTGGRLAFRHLEVIRLKTGRKMTPNMFAVWRVDDPWQPVTKRGVGKRLGGGKGAIDHYVTPVKAGRIIFEVGGQCDFQEVKIWLQNLADMMPFRAIAVDEKALMAIKKLQELKEQRNVNPYTYKYLTMNDMCGSRNWVKDLDKVYFGKYT